MNNNNTRGMFHNLRKFFLVIPDNRIYLSLFKEKSANWIYLLWISFPNKYLSLIACVKFASIDSYVISEGRRNFLNWASHSDETGTRRKNVTEYKHKRISQHVCESSWLNTNHEILQFTIISYVPLPSSGDVIVMSFWVQQYLRETVLLFQTEML